MNDMTKLSFDLGWVETIDKHKCLIYSDTDSSYNLIKLPFNKFEDDHKTVDYSQVKAKEINDLYLDTLNTNHAELAGIDPEFNLMNFKSEVVAYRGFFRSKKYYALAKIWDEGNFFDEPKLKTTGGQIKKSDATQIALEMLKEIYDIIVLKFDITDEKQLCKMIYIDTKKKYIEKIKDSVENHDLQTFSIPKKWGLKEYKDVPTHIIGAMLYNTLVKDILRPGDSLMTFHIKLKGTKNLYNYVKNKKSQSKYQINSTMLNNIISKINYISIPYSSANNRNEIKELFEIMQKNDIDLDFDSIVEFNINKKIIQFVDLFDDTIFKSLGLNKKLL